MYVCMILGLSVEERREWCNIYIGASGVGLRSAHEIHMVVVVDDRKRSHGR